MIQILNTIETYGTHFEFVPETLFTIVFPLMVMGMLFFLWTLEALDKHSYLSFAISIAVLCWIVIMSIGLTLWVGTIKNKEPDITYKVTIDENISYKEFTQKYEVLDQEGLIYTVKERQ